MINSATVEQAPRNQLVRTQASGASYVDINSGELHRGLGDYPRPNARMPTVCNVMRKLMNAGDRVLLQPPKGKGASLTIRYMFPR